MRHYSITLLSALCCFALIHPAQADMRIQGAKQCTSYIPGYEREYGVPAHLLSAIASAESGRFHKGLNILLPWPWTINVEGKGYYFDSKAEAVAAVKQFQRQGKTSIDVGRMQVNLRHHGHAFASVEQAMEPRNNVRYAASFLRELYESEHSWRRAAAAYHSKTPSKGGKYVSRVFRAWETIIARLRIPRSDTIQLANRTNDPAVRLTRGSDYRPAASQTASQQASIAETPAHQPVKMKLIKVNDIQDQPISNLVMIRPDVAPSSLEKAQRIKQPNLVRLDREMTSEGVAKGRSLNHYQDANIVHLTGKRQHDAITLAALGQLPASEETQKAPAPRFIFTD